MAINFLPNPIYRFKDGNDDPLVGGLVFTYDTGTTNKQTVWKDKAKVAAHTNPIVLDARGEAEIWFDGTIDLVTAPAGDTDPPSSPIETVVGAQSSETPVTLASPGMVLNSSFETSATDLTNWTSSPAAGATIAVDTANQSDGSHAVKFTAGGSGGGTLISEFIPITRSNVIALNGMVKSDLTSITNAVKIAFYDQSKVANSTVVLWQNNGDSSVSWNEFGGNVTPTGSDVWCKIELHGSSAGSGTTWFDRIVMNQEKDTDYASLYAQNGKLLNASFASGVGYPRHWTMVPVATSKIELVVDNQTSNQALKFTSIDATGGGGVVSEFFPTSTGLDLVIEAFIKSSVTTLVNQIQVEIYNTTKTLVTTVTAYDSGGVSSTSYERVIGSVPGSSMLVFAKIKLLGAVGAPGVVNFDRIHVTDEFDDSLKYCRVKRTNNISLPGAAAWQTMAWDDEDDDVWNTHSTSVNTSRITPPSWVKTIRIKAFIRIDDTFTLNVLQTRTIKNGSTATVFAAGRIEIGAAGGGSPFPINSDSGWLKISAGDYFEVQVIKDSGGNFTVLGTTSWFEIEFKAK